MPIRGLAGSRLGSALAVVASCLLLCLAQATAQAQEAGPYALVVISCEDTGAMEQIIASIEEAGGTVRHIFPTHVLIGQMTDQVIEALSGNPRVDLVSRGHVAPEAVPEEYGREARDAVAAWNRVFVTPAPKPEAEGMAGPPLLGDVRLRPPMRFPAPGLAARAYGPPGAAYWQTSEYLMGRVVVSLIFVESNGAIDPQTENWTGTQESNVVAETLAGANWWISQYPYSAAPLSFTWVYNYGRPTGYEPITRPSSNDGLWMAQVLTGLGYPCNAGTYFGAALDYADDLRNNNNRDWAYSVFVVDDTNDADKAFSDGYFAYAYLSGPLLVMTYDNAGWGIANMDKIYAHETGHIFWANDEYCQPGYFCCDSNEYTGYLNIQNTNCDTGVTCIMNTNAWAACSVTRLQLGWRDLDLDGRPDILDVAPTALLNAYSPDPTNDDTPTYTGSGSVSFYPNQYWPGYDVTLNRIANVQYRVDGGTWQDCTASDGAFDGGTEGFTFTPSPLAGGQHTFEVRATDTSGNVTPPPYPSDTLTVTHTLSVTASADPTVVPSGGTSDLTAGFADSGGHGVASWSWDDGGAGGSFSPSATIQNPTYTAPLNTGGTSVIVTLTAQATCNGPYPVNGTGSTDISVQPASHTFDVTAALPDPSTVASGGATSLSATYADGAGHGAASWSWDDSGAGGNFSPSATIQNPSYTAPTNLSDSDLIVTLTVSATCDGPEPLGDSDQTTLTVQPVVHSFSVGASAAPTSVKSGGSTSLSASYTDSRDHGVAAWSWDDGGAGGVFRPSAVVQNPSYTAPVNLSGDQLPVFATVTATCDGQSGLVDSDTVILSVQPPGTDTIGLYNPASGTFYLRDSNSAGAADRTFRYGPAPSSWVPISGDWDGLWDETVGLFNPATGTVYLRNANAGGAADLTFRFGPAPSTWSPITGDWDGDGDATIGLYNPANGTFYLRNTNSAGAANLTFRYGPTASTWTPVLGDWNGDGDETIGLYNAANGTFYLKNANTAGAADLTFRYGPTASTWKPVTGDWNQDGADTIGLYNPANGTFYLRNTNSAGAANLTFRYGPTASTWIPTAGDWDGS